MVPMWLQGLILPLIVWLFTKVIAFAPIPTVMFQMWYCPFPIATWLTTGNNFRHSANADCFCRGGSDLVSIF